MYHRSDGNTPLIIDFSEKTVNGVKAVVVDGNPCTEEVHAGGFNYALCLIFIVILYNHQEGCSIA